MRRKLFTFVSAVSLLVCLAAVVLWVRSYWVWDSLPRLNHDAVEVDSVAGQVSVEWVEGNYVLVPIEPSHQPASNYLPRFGGAVVWRMVGFQYESRSISLNTLLTIRAIVIPYWFLFAATLALPASHVVAYFKRRLWRATNGCRTCDYNLTGNTSRMCPECGTAIESRSAPPIIRDFSN